MRRHIFTLNIFFSWLNSIVLSFLMIDGRQRQTVHTKTRSSSVYLDLVPADVARGESLFQQNCSSCHPQGNNVIVKERTLKKEALEKFIFLKDDENTIVNFVKDDNFHRGALAFGSKLNKQDFADVASFVYEQAMEEKW